MRMKIGFIKAITDLLYLNRPIKIGQVVKRIIAYIIILLGLLAFEFFRHYNGQVIPYTFGFGLLGLALFLIGGWWLRNTPTIKQSKEALAAKQFTDDLKANGDKISIDLGNCEVKENKYSEERLRGGNYGEGTPIGEEQNLDLLTKSGGIYRNNDRIVVQINQTVVTGEVMRYGKPFKFQSQVLRHDRETLLFKMFAQKETSLYIDRNNPERYYLPQSTLMRVSFMH